MDNAMNLGDIGRLVRENLDKLPDIKEAEILTDLREFLDTLEKKGSISLAQASASIRRWRPITPSKRAQMQNVPSTVRTAASQLRSLLEEVGSWDEPDFDQIHRRVSDSCIGLKNDDLLLLSKEFIGRAPSTKSRSGFLEWLARPVVLRVQRRFKYVAA